MANLRYLFKTCASDTFASHLMKALPRALKGSARVWYAAQSDAFKESELGDLDGWEKQLCQAFPQDRQQPQLAAKARVWNESRESTTQYALDKIKLHKLAFEEQTDEALVDAIVAGVPPRFALLLKKEDGSWPSRLELLEVLQKHEARWRKAGP